MKQIALLAVFSFILSCDEGVVEIAGDVIHPDSATELDTQGDIAAELVDVDQDVEPDVQPDVQPEVQDEVVVDVPEDIPVDVEPQQFEVSIGSDPTGASVSIDELQDVCVTPCTQTLTAATHVFLFVLEGYDMEMVEEEISETNSSVFVTLTETSPDQVEVSIDSDPQGASVSIDGVLDICDTPCIQTVMIGEHTFDFALEGYEPESVTQVVDVENDTVFVTLTELSPPEVEVSIDSDPQGATVAVDGEADACTTPCTQSLTVGQHEFVFTLDGYETATVEEDISDTNNSVFATLVELPPENVEVTIDSEPQGATVSIDGVLDLCTTPCTQTMLIGEHTFDIALDGYEPESVTQVVDLDNDTVFVTLTALPVPEVDVDIDSDPQGASVAIDGEADICVTPCTQSLTEGTHEFVFTLDGYETETVNEDISDTNNSVFATLTELPPQVLVSINSDPQLATVMIDDVPDVCVTPCEHSMSEGLHDFVFTVEPYDPVSMQVDISETNNTVFAVIDTVPTIEVTVVATPPNTTVTIDDTYVDTAPFNVDLKEGLHHFVYTNPGYITQEYDEFIDADNNYFFVTLQAGK